MGENSVPFLCGGTFYILLLQSLKKDRRIRINDLDGYGAKEKAINDVTCLKGLVRTFYAFNEHFSDSTFTAHKDQYKFCRKNSTDWLKFETPALINAFNAKVKDNYAEALTAMNTFIDGYLDQCDLGEHLVRALLEVMDLDKTIGEDTLFYIQAGGRTVSKTDLLALPKINARQFLLAVWHFIVTERGSENVKGSDTVEAWLQHTGKQAAYKYAGTMGDEYALDKEITFEAVDVESVEDAADFVEEAEKVEGTVESEEDTGKQDQGEKTVNEILNTQAVFNQRAEKIVNIGHVDHLEI